MFGRSKEKKPRLDQEQMLADWLILALWGGVSIALAWLFRQGSLDDQSLISLEILWITAVAVIRYTKETYHLRALSKFQLDTAQKQLKEVEETRMNEFLPILVPEEDGYIRSGDMRFVIQNAGKGVASQVNVHLVGFEIHADFTILAGEKQEIKIDGNNHIAGVTDNPEASELYAEIRYKDIYDRSFRTTNIAFVREGNSHRFALQRGGWKFE